MIYVLITTKQTENEATFYILYIDGNLNFYMKLKSVYKAPLNTGQSKSS